MVVTRTLGAPGAYVVTLVVWTDSERKSRVRVHINRTTLRTFATSRRRSTKLSLRIIVLRRKLVVSAVDVAGARVTLRVSTTKAGATRGLSGAGGGATGVSGPAGLGDPTAIGLPILPDSPGPSVVSGPPGDPASWRLIFDDEFNAANLDTSLWSTGWNGSEVNGPINEEELECYDPAHVVEGGGELDLNLTSTTDACPTGDDSTGEPYTSGIISSLGKFSFTYGYVEARIWLPGASAITDWPAFWAIGTNGNWPGHGELDVVEGLLGSACWHFHSPSGAAGGCATGNYAGAWHTFAADWERGIVTSYYDGVKQASLTAGVTDFPMYLLIDLAVDDNYGGAIQAPATMRVDYVRIYQQR